MTYSRVDEAQLVISAVDANYESDNRSSFVLGRIRRTQAVLLDIMGEGSRALPKMKEALAKIEDAMDSDHFDTIQTQARLGILLEKEGRHEEASKMIYETRQRAERV